MRLALRSAVPEPMPDSRPPKPQAPPLQLRVAAHDQSRVEWICTVPMAPPGQTHDYVVTLQCEVPDAIWVAHDPWQRYQVRTRLTSPALQDVPAAQLASDPRDRTRLRALAVAHALRTAGKQPVAVLHAVARRDQDLSLGEAEAVVAGLEHALGLVSQHRHQAIGPDAVSEPSLRRETALADEYVSGHVLLLLTRFRAALHQRPRRGRPPLHGETRLVQDALTRALADEHAYRKQQRMPQPSPHTPAEVEAYVNHSALLKKHFQQALFLDATAYMLDERLRNWIAATMAMVAAVFYFVWQVSVLNAVTAGATTVSLALAAVVGALVYAAKDRIKEVGRTWLAEKLKHTYADRVARLRLQARMDPSAQEFVLARETITVQRDWVADRFNPELGRTTPVYRVLIRERLRHTGLQQLHARGLLGLKHVFRYDLSPLLAKLDDTRKHVPVLGPGGLVLRSAARIYALPVTVRLCREDAGGEQELLVQRGHVLLRGRQLVRFAPLADA